MKTILSIVIFWIAVPAASAHVGITLPAGGEEFKSGSDVTIRWFIEVDHGECMWNIYFSDDNGYTWIPVAENLSKSQLEYNWTIPALQTSYGRIKVLQNNYIGIDYEIVSGSFTITAEITGTPQQHMPGSYILYPLYPNPFNASAIISFLLPQEDHVELVVYNAAGEKILTLVNNSMPPGFHSFRWDADALASGVYLYSLKTKNFFKIRKAVLLK